MMDSIRNVSDVLKSESVLSGSTAELIEELVGLYPNFDIGDIASVLPKVIRHVKTLNKIEVSEKQEYIVNTLLILVDKTDGPGNDDIWDPIFKKMIPSLVDAFIDIDDGKIKLSEKKARKVFSKCC